MGIISRARAGQKRKAPAPPSLKHSVRECQKRKAPAPLSLKHSVRECHRRRHADKELIRLRHQEENGALRQKLEEAEAKMEAQAEALAKAQDEAKAREAEAKAHEAEAKAHEAEAKVLQASLAARDAEVASLQADKDRYSDLEYYLMVGDWHAKNIQAMRWAETELEQEARNTLRAYLVKTGVHPSLHNQRAEAGGRWVMFTGVLSDLLGPLSKEADEIKRWRDDGENVDALPLTPLFLRLHDIARVLGMDFRAAFEAIRDYGIRNIQAHSGVPNVHEYLVGSGANRSINWAGVHAACDVAFARIEDAEKSGRITADALEKARLVIETWKSTTVAGWNSNGTPIVTKYGNEVLDRVTKVANKAPAKAARKAAIPVECPYKEGQNPDMIAAVASWDDI